MRQEDVGGPGAGPARGPANLGLGTYVLYIVFAYGNTNLCLLKRNIL